MEETPIFLFPVCVGVFAHLERLLSDIIAKKNKNKKKYILKHIFHICKYLEPKKKRFISFSEFWN